MYYVEDTHTRAQPCKERWTTGWEEQTLHARAALNDGRTVRNELGLSPTESATSLYSSEMPMDWELNKQSKKKESFRKWL